MPAKWRCGRWPDNCPQPAQLNTLRPLTHGPGAAPTYAINDIGDSSSVMQANGRGGSDQRVRLIERVRGLANVG
jgi:hypothetical protein